MKYAKLLMALVAISFLVAPAFSMSDHGFMAKGDDGKQMGPRSMMGDASEGKLVCVCVCKEVAPGEDGKDMPMAGEKMMPMAGDRMKDGPKSMMDGCKNHEMGFKDSERGFMPAAAEGFKDEQGCQFQKPEMGKDGCRDGPKSMMGGEFKGDEGCPCPKHHILKARMGADGCQAGPKSMMGGAFHEDGCPCPKAMAGDDCEHEDHFAHR